MHIARGSSRAIRNVLMHPLRALRALLGGLRPHSTSDTAEGQADLPPSDLPSLVFPARTAAATPMQTARVQQVPTTRIELHPPAPPEAPESGATLHLLPGRLEVVSGLDERQEIRLMRGSEREPTVTLGSAEGALPGHVQLRGPRVSPRHASLTYRRGHWVLTNLSRLDPVLLDGRRMPLSEQADLKDGTLIQLGDVVLRFRTR